MALPWLPCSQRRPLVARISPKPAARPLRLPDSSGWAATAMWSAARPLRIARSPCLSALAHTSMHAPEASSAAHPLHRLPVGVFTEVNSQSVTRLVCSGAIREWGSESWAFRGLRGGPPGMGAPLHAQRDRLVRLAVRLSLWPAEHVCRAALGRMSVGACLNIDKFSVVSNNTTMEECSSPPKGGRQN